ncbi:ImuA family protein [Acidisoma cladoniae]|uniref:ImuA family protein n=1 Tax=Acidisoma cladoniae TaxID=3040935 RepID=UPI00254C7F19|nr:damage-inducible mutagenesis protein [Acidisoma sp. PAMC 29798]
MERKSDAKAAIAVLPFEIDAIDRHLPGGGLRLGGLHDVADAGPGLEHGTAAVLMVAGILARLPGPVLWVTEQRDLFAPALAHVGLDPNRVLHVEAGRDAARSVLVAMEEGLRHPGFAGIVGEVRRLDSTASRRLQLAAETSGVTVFTLRRSRTPDDPALMTPIAALTRWRIARQSAGPPLPHAPQVRGLAPAVWRIDLIRCRGAEPATWSVEACDATGHLRLAADVAHRSVAKGHRRRAG